MGLGHTAMKTFAALLSQKGLHLKTFQKKQHRILDAFISAAEDILTDSATAVKHHLAEVVGEPEDGVYDVTVLMGRGTNEAIPHSMASAQL